MGEAGGEISLLLLSGQREAPECLRQLGVTDTRQMGPTSCMHAHQSSTGTTSRTVASDNGGVHSYGGCCTAKIACTINHHASQRVACDHINHINHISHINTLLLSLRFSWTKNHDISMSLVSKMSLKWSLTEMRLQTGCSG